MDDAGFCAAGFSLDGAGAFSDDAGAGFADDPLTRPVAVALDCDDTPLRPAVAEVLLDALASALTERPRGARSARPPAPALASDADDALLLLGLGASAAGAGSDAAGFAGSDEASGFFGRFDSRYAFSSAAISADVIVPA